eukprot:3891284-Rhodomonas_salina.1
MAVAQHAVLTYPCPTSASSRDFFSSYTGLLLPECTPKCATTAPGSALSSRCDSKCHEILFFQCARFRGTMFGGLRKDAQQTHVTEKRWSGIRGLGVSAKRDLERNDHRAGASIRAWCLVIDSTCVLNKR